MGATLSLGALLAGSGAAAGQMLSVVGTPGSTWPQ